MQYQRAVQPREIRIRQGERHGAVIRSILQTRTERLILFVDDLRSELESVSAAERVHEASTHVAAGGNLARDHRILFRESHQLGADIIHPELETVRRHGAQSHPVSHIEVLAQGFPQQQVRAFEVLRIELLGFRVKILEAAGITGLSVHLLETGNARRLFQAVRGHEELVTFVDDRLDDTHCGRRLFR